MKKLAGLFCLLLAACGASPLLNHAPAPVEELRARDRGERSECALVFAQSGLCAKLEWLAAPAAEAGGIFSLRFWSKESGTSAGPWAPPPGRLQVYLWMPEHGHGSSPVSLEGDAGDYRVSDVYFIMPGNWDIRIQIQAPDQGISEEVGVRYVAP